MKFILLELSNLIGQFERDMVQVLPPTDSDYAPWRFVHKVLSLIN